MIQNLFLYFKYQLYTFVPCEKNSIDGRKCIRTQQDLTSDKTAE